MYIWLTTRENGQNDICVKCHFKSAVRTKTTLSIFKKFFSFEEVYLRIKSYAVIKCQLRFIFVDWAG